MADSKGGAGGDQGESSSRKRRWVMDGNECGVENIVGSRQRSRRKRVLVELKKEENGSSKGEEDALSPSRDILSGEKTFDGGAFEVVHVPGPMKLWERSYTISMWVRPKFTIPNQRNRIQGILSGGKWPEVRGPHVHVMLHDMIPFFSHFGQGAFCQKKLVCEKWAHLAVVYDVKKHLQLIYINGECEVRHQPSALIPFQKDKVLDSYATETTSTFFVGKCTFAQVRDKNAKSKKKATCSSQGNCFRGNVADVKIFVGSALSEREILTESRTLYGDEDPGVDDSFWRRGSGVGGAAAASGAKCETATLQRRQVRGNAVTEADRDDDSKKKKTPSRAFASLGTLTKKFVRMLKQAGTENMLLSEAALRLGVQKRRVYDITNVLEGIGLIEKKPKGMVEWKGAEHYNREDSDRRNQIVTEICQLEKVDNVLLGYVQYMQQSTRTVAKESGMFLSRRDFDLLLAAWPTSNHILAVRSESEMDLDVSWKRYSAPTNRSPLDDVDGETRDEDAHSSSHTNGSVQDFCVDIHSRKQGAPLSVYVLTDDGPPVERGRISRGA